MSAEIKILFVEDGEADIEACQSSKKVFERKHSCKIDLVHHKALDTAISDLDNSYDGAIIDLNLKDEEGGEATYEGNDVLKLIHADYRMPVAILTGTPEQVEEKQLGFLGVYKKGNKTYEELFDDFVEIQATGLTNIFCGRGVVESALQNIFWTNILPQINSWRNSSFSPEEKQNSLLRYSLNHLTEKLDNQFDKCIPEEMYISPPVSHLHRTGGIVQEKDTGKHFIILSPACDLAIRKSGNFKTDRILICNIDDFGPIRDEIIEELPADKRQAGKKRGKIEELIKNNWKIYYHWLPEGMDFPGGIINFRKTLTFTEEDFKSNFTKPILQVSSHFLKDIVARYSSFYARQGQPDFHFSSIAKKLFQEI